MMPATTQSNTKIIVLIVCTSLSNNNLNLHCFNLNILSKMNANEKKIVCTLWCVQLHILYMYPVTVNLLSCMYNIKEI